MEHTFSCLTDILFRTSHWTISNYCLLNTRLIEAEYSVNNRLIFTEFSNIANQIGNNSLHGIARSLNSAVNCTSKPKKKSSALFSSVDSPS